MCGGGGGGLEGVLALYYVGQYTGPTQGAAIAQW